jgi:hypothetical protein
MATFFPTAKSDPELAAFRPALEFGFFNALTWQIAIGTPMVLFAGQLGASAFEVGLAYSFVFLLTPLQIFATTLLPRYGFKQVALGGWGVRSLFLIVPIVLAAIAPPAAPRWMVWVLIASVFWFCLFRSIGASAMTTWFMGFLPAGVRGRYFAHDQFFSGIAGVGTLITCATLFLFLPMYQALLIQYVIALVGSTLAYYSLRRLPDIDKPPQLSLTAVLGAAIRHAVKPSVFRSYLWLAVWYSAITTSIPPFAAYFLKVTAGLSAAEIMFYEVLRYGGVVLGAWLIARRIDHTGARPFFLLSLVLLVLVAAAWLIFLRFGFGGTPMLLLIYAGVGLTAVCWAVANLNFLPKIVPAGDRALFVALHGAATACLGGLSPILWGIFLKRTSPTGEPLIDVPVFELFFVLSIVSACVLSALMARLPEDTKASPHPLVIGNAILRPFRAASYVANLIDWPMENKPAAEPDFKAHQAPPNQNPSGRL